MSNNIDIKEKIMYIEKISKINRNVYIFVGIRDEKIKNILKNFESEKYKKITDKTEQELLKKNFSNELGIWSRYVNEKVKIKFIYNYIKLNDSLNNIKKKIFYYCSEPTKNKFILPENQEIWIKNKNNEDEIIGLFYEDKNRNKIKMKPFIYDLKNNSNVNKYIINNSENNTLLYDLMDEIKFKNNILYFIDINEELKYYNKKLEKSTLNKLIKKHFPYANLDYKLSEVKNDYIINKKIYEKEEKLNKLFLTYKDSELLGEYKITYMILKANEVNQIKNDTNETNETETLDLFQVLDYLREKKLGNKIPFIKYGDDTFNIPITLVSTESIKNNVVSKNKLNEWMGYNRITTKINGILLKNYLKDDNNMSQYISLIIRKNYELTLKLNFDINDNIGINDVSLSIKNTKTLIDEINTIMISENLNKQKKIETPDINMNNNKIELKKNTTLKYCNIYIPFINYLKLDYKELYNFSKKFPEYLYDENKNSNQKNTTDFVNNIKLRYKKISGFIPMNDIIKDIDLLKYKNQTDNEIIQYLSIKYDKTQEEIRKYMLEWQKKYSTYMSKKINPEYKIGVEIEITDSHIKLNQITNFYQIDIIYQFIKNFLLMFLNKNNKNINKIQNRNNQYEKNNNYIVSYTCEQRLMNKYNQEYKNNIEYEEDIDEIEYNNISKNNKLNYINKFNRIGIADDSELSPEVKLKCNDAVPEQGRCSDFCNDTSYYLRRLQKYDLYLFKFSKNNNNKNKSQYAVQCGVAQGRQPLVLDHDPSDNPKIKKNSYTYSLKYSSKPEEYERWYICPNIWCPVCEISLSEDEINKNTIQRRVVRSNQKQCETVLCPYDNSHQAIIRNTTDIYPGFLKNKHPDGIHCLPCCFKKAQNNEKSSVYSLYKKCIGEDIINMNSKDGSLYILGKSSPIEKNRYGILPTEICRILNTKIETGYLGINKGYLKKGINHKKNQSFLSCILNIISCLENNLNINEIKLKKLLIEKLNIDLFKSLYNGNLENVFHDPKHNLTGFENFKKYLNNDEILITHKYLWDYIQRENILYKNGINLIIFEKNEILCPLGENVIDFYDTNKKTIMILKTNNYYEPIYYLEGNGKSASRKCIFNSELIEIKKVLEIVKNGCKPSYDIDWEKVLKNNIETFNVKNVDIIYKFNHNLLEVIQELLISIKNKKLSMKFIPVLQYIDSYNKVYGILLKNGIFIPVEPSKLYEKIKYKEKPDLDSSDIVDYKKVIDAYKEIEKNTKLKYKIRYKILDDKENKYIIALLTNDNRIIPVKKVLDKEKNLLVSPVKYFNGVNRFIQEKIIMNDKRIEKINKKNFEEETFNRLRFELSIFLQKNKSYFDKMKQIINSQNQHSNVDLNKNRKKMYLLLDEIYSKITVTKDKDIDFYNYKTPNKRFPCWMRSTKNKITNKKNNYTTLFKCETDPHCINVNKKCKLYIHKTNLIELFKNIKNYQHYLSKLLDELLRFKIKREEILNNDIPYIINKTEIPENEDKYIIFKTFNIEEIKNRIEQLYFNNYGIFLDKRKLIEESRTKNYGFNKNLYLKEEYKNSNIDFSNLSIYWNKILGYKFKIKNYIHNVFEIFSEAIKTNQNFYLKNKELDVSQIKKDLVNHWYDIVKDASNKNKDKTEMNIYKNYKENCAKKIKNILNYEDLMTYLLTNEYKGCFIDFKVLSLLYNVNVVFLLKTIKKNDKGYTIVKSNQSTYYILVYESIINNQSIYNLIGIKNKFLFHLNELSPKFREEVLLIN